MASLTVAEIAERLGASFDGDGGTVIRGIAGIRYAVEGDISYVSLARYTSDAESSKASAIIVGRDWAHASEKPLIRADDPDKAFTQVANWYAPPAVTYQPGVHPTAVISPDAVIGTDVHIGPYCVIGSNVSIGDRTVLIGQNFIADGVSIGEDGLIYPQVTIREYAQAGDRVIIHNGSVIGSDGFGYDVDDKGVRTKVPQIGIVEIGDDVEIGANVTIDRARFGKTIIGNGVKIDNLVQIAHNVHIGEHAVIVAQVGIAGSSSIGKHAILAGQSGVVGHVSVGDGTVVGAQSAVLKDAPPKSYLVGFPAIPQKQFAVNQANVNRIPILKKRIADLEARIQSLENK